MLTSLTRGALRAARAAARPLRAVGPGIVAMLAADYATGSSAAATVTLQPASGYRIVILGILASYAAAPTGGQVTVGSAGRPVLRRFPVTAAGPAPITPPGGGWAGLVDEVLTVTLANGAVVGHLNVDWTQVA